MHVFVSQITNYSAPVNLKCQGLALFNTKLLEMGPYPQESKEYGKITFDGVQHFFRVKIGHPSCWGDVACFPLYPFDGPMSSTRVASQGPATGSKEQPLECILSVRRTPCLFLADTCIVHVL